MRGVRWVKCYQAMNGCEKAEYCGHGVHHTMRYDENGQPCDDNRGCGFFFNNDGREMQAMCVEVKGNG